ncbi:hypothetical protein PQR46_12455 [Paraburkholderia sediminicola]|uniref:hypothetical protein n=1 Tax=Paraburkholderia TaxID=1822464 RepID=UPI0038B7A868
MQRYTRADFIAFRFRLITFSTSHIFSEVYREDALLASRIETLAQMEALLDEIRDRLAERVCLSNPYLSANLADPRKFNRWIKSVADFLVKATDQDYFAPEGGRLVSAWFRAIVYQTVRQDRVKTLAELKALVELCAAGRPAATLGRLVVVPREQRTYPVELNPDAKPVMVPFERVVESLNGSRARNGAPGFCHIFGRRQSATGRQGADD